MANTASDLLHRFEGFIDRPRYDRNALRIGYGSDTITLPDGTVQQVTENTGPITEEDAQRDLDRRIVEFQQRGIIPYIGQDAWDRLPPETQAALTSVAYNYGSLAGLPSIVRAAQSGDANQLATAVANRAVDNEGQNANRRNQEAAIIAGHPIPPADIPLPGWVQSGGAAGRGQLQDIVSPPVPAVQSGALQNNRDHPLEQPTPLQPNLKPILAEGSPALQAAKARLAAARAGTGKAGGGDAAKSVDTSQPASQPSPAAWIASNQPNSTRTPSAQPLADSPANPLRNDAWANIVATPSAKPYTGNEINVVGREVPLPEQKVASLGTNDLPIPQLGNTLGSGATRTAGGIAGSVQMPAGARPSSVPTIAGWLPASKSGSALAAPAANGSALPSKAPWLPMGAALPIDGTTMIAQPIAPNLINSPPARPVTGPTIAATPIKPSDDVRAVQNALRQAGYGISVDGLMGPQTDAAIRAFQKAQGLVVDGIVGPKTSMALQRSLPVNGQTNPLLNLTFGFTAPAAPGAKPAVKAPVVVQKAPQQTTAEQHYAQTGTYRDSDPSNNAINFQKNAGSDGFSDFLSGEL